MSETIPTGEDLDEARRASAELERLRREHAEQSERIAQLEREVEAWRARAAVAEEDQAAWLALQVKSGWRIYVALAALRFRAAPLGTRRDALVRGVLRPLAVGAERLGRGRTARAPVVPAEARAEEKPELSLDEQYALWLERHALDDGRIRAIRAEAARLRHRPTISVLLTAADADAGALEASVASVRAQLYEEWELCLAGGAAAATGDGAGDSRIRLSASAGWSEALALASGEFVALLAAGDELKPDALFEVARLLDESPGLDYVYTDEDRRDDRGALVDPFFKPDWAPDLLLATNYAGRLAVLRRDLVERVGGFRSEHGGAEDYDLVLRVTEETDRIGHVPRPLYTARRQASPSAPAPVEDALRRRGIDGEVTAADGRAHRVRYAVPSGFSVTIVIPTRDRVGILRRCIASIEERTSFSNYELVVVDNESEDEETLEFLAGIPGRVLSCPGEFNFSRIVNAAAREVDSDALVLLNNDTEVIAPDWLDALVEHGARAEVGAVGARLLFPDGRVQHDGIVVGLGGSAGNADHSGHRGLSEVVRNCSAVTAACMLTRTSVFREVGGFDERMPIAFNDVDYCLRARERGYRVVYTPYALLYHHEGGTRGKKSPIQDEELFVRRWGKHALFRDPYYNPNLSLRRPFALRLDEPE